MNIFANKKIWKRIAIIIGIIAFIGFILPKPSEAASIGGILMSGIMDLFVGIADGIQTIIHKIFVQQDIAIYMISEGINWYGIALGILAGIVLVASHIVTLGFVITAGIIILTLHVFGVGDVVFNTTRAITTSMLNDDTIALPTFTLTPYEIFTNEEGLFSVDFFTKDNKKSKIKGNSISLNQNISDWYATLRLIAIVGMMSVLVYMGIRILLSSTAESAAKYKKMMWDWVVATFLIFTMQYIMVFANFMVNSLVDTIGTIKVESGATNKETNKKLGTIPKDGIEGYIIGASVEGDKLTIDTDTTDLVKQAYKELVNNGQGNSQGDFEKNFYQDEQMSTNASDEGSAKILFWPADNFVTQARMNAQFVRNSDGGEIADYIGYGLIYVALTIYTVMFIFVYIKRYVYMVFLTLISPLVALTYPIDKVKDGQAQAFNFWFKEYLYNLLLQPLHLILYMLLIGSAMRFAANNPLYVVVCLGFMLPAEKLLKAMFGFKGQTPGSMPGLAAGALMMTAARKAFGGSAKGGGSGSQSKDIKGQSEEEASKIETKDVDNLFDVNGDISNDGVHQANINSEEENNEGIEAGETGQENNSDEANTSHRSKRRITRPLRMAKQIPGMAKKGILDFKDDITSKEWRDRWVADRAHGAIKFAQNVGSETIKTAGNIAGGALVGSVGAATGGLIGMVSGDPSKAFEYSTALGAAGYAIGSKGGKNIQEGITNVGQGVIDKVKDEYYKNNPDEYEQKVNEEINRNFRNDKNKMATLERNLSKEQFRKLTKPGGSLEIYNNHGITDAKEIAALEKFRYTSGNRVLSEKEAMGYQKTYQEFHKGMKGENRDKFEAMMKRKIEKQVNRKLTDDEMKAAIRNTENMMSKYGDIKKMIR